MNRLIAIPLLLSCLVLAGCSTYATGRYSISPDNVVVLRNYENVRISVGEFTATEPGLTELSCRMAMPIQTPDKTTFEEYIRQAFIDEMQIAGIYSEDAPVILTGHLDKISFSSMSGKWYIDLTVTTKGGQSISVQTIYDYSSSFFGEAACNQTAQAFVPAVQELIKSVILHDEFPEIIRQDS